ncbi:hypothetical protein ACQP1V_31155 [Microtetraspora malaysiensis]|uniref:hypothetical protein n=1 Tax=Microtetraspora malaysiensis TaxID=161358 RepID=UPI003D8CDAB5
MTEVGKSRRALRAPSELNDVYEFLDKVRLRPSMWVWRGSLQHLYSMLAGYAIAQEIHGIDESFDFDNDGPFAEWLWPRLGMSYSSALGWAAEIENAAEKSSTPAMELFFTLLDEFRAERDHAQDPSAK